MMTHGGRKVGESLKGDIKRFDVGMGWIVEDHRLAGKAQPAAEALAGLVQAAKEHEGEAK